ncbi:MAG: O-antigen ligase family protein [Verrucomicrobiales bacterium]|nr:O-antigen ligase family protein [Verrucomicrobiales bacterium]
MRALLFLLPCLMLYRYLSDSGMAGMLMRLVFLGAFGAVGWLMVTSASKPRLAPETRWFLVMFAIFGLQYSLMISEYMTIMGGISRSFMLLLVAVPLGSVILGALLRDRLPWPLPVCQTGLAMLGLAFLGFVAERLGFANVHGTNIEASGTEIISRERMGLTFIGGVVPSATFLAIAMSSLVASLFQGRTFIRVATGTSLLICTTLVLLTGTRGALSIVFAVSVLIGLGVVQRLRRRPLRSAILALLAVILIPALYPKVFPFLDNLELNLALEPLRRDSQSTVFDLTGRVDAWERSLDYFAESRNLLLGYGPEAEIVAGLSAELGSLPHPAFAGRDDLHAHNLLYNLLFSGGACMVIPYLVMMALAIKRALIHSEDPRVASLLGMLLAWIGIGIHESLLWTHIYFFYFVLCGILAELYLATPESGPQTATAKSGVRTPRSATAKSSVPALLPGQRPAI